MLKEGPSSSYTRQQYRSSICHVIPSSIEGSGNPLDSLHNRLLTVVTCKDLDYEPFGLIPREREDKWGPDCSMGCKFFHPLEELPLDWGVCSNQNSHRCGLLTFEHQGCRNFVEETEDNEE